MRVEAKLAEMGITLPDYSKEGYPGATFGTMKSHHRVGKRSVPQRPRALEGRGSGRYRDPWQRCHH